MRLAVGMSQQPGSEASCRYESADTIRVCENIRIRSETLNTAAQVMTLWGEPD